MTKTAHDWSRAEAMTDAEISDVTAWIASHRTNEFGQPLTSPNP